MASGFAAREILWCSNAHPCLAESQSICSLYICLMWLHFISNVMPHAIHKGSAHQLARTALDHHLNMPCSRKQAEGSQPWSKANSYNVHYNQLTHWNIVIKCLPSAWQPARCKEGHRDKQQGLASRRLLSTEPGEGWADDRQTTQLTLRDTVVNVLQGDTDLVPVLATHPSAVSYLEREGSCSAMRTMLATVVTSQLTLDRSADTG